MMKDQLITDIESHLAGIDRPKTWLCNKLNVSTQTFNNWRTRGIPQRHLEAISEVFEWSYPDLLLGRIVPSDGIVNIPLYTPLSNQNDVVEPSSTIPFITTITFSLNWLRSKLTYTEISNLSILSGGNTNVQSPYRDGEVLLIDDGVNVFSVDGVYLLSSHNELFIKRIEKMINGGLQISSDNAEYKPYTIQGDDLKDIKIVAKVIWVLTGKPL